MRTPAARALHLALILVGAVLYVVFVLPRWWVLTGDVPATLATAGRIAAGIPIAAAAYPVMQILQDALRRKARTPEIALRLRAWSAVLYAVAGGLILIAAVAEIWLSLEAGGPWLFGVYGGAGAIAVLAFLALYLSFVAEKPPAGPKPPKTPKAKKPAKTKPAKAEKKPRGKKRDTKPAAPTGPPTDAETETTAEAETSEAAEPAVVGAEIAPTTTETDEPSAEPAEDPQPAASALRNKRPAGKSRRRLGR